MLTGDGNPLETVEYYFCAPPPFAVGWQRLMSAAWVDWSPGCPATAAHNNRPKVPKPSAGAVCPRHFVGWPRPPSRPPILFLRAPAVPIRGAGTHRRYRSVPRRYATRYCACAGASQVLNIFKESYFFPSFSSRGGPAPGWEGDGGLYRCHLRAVAHAGTPSVHG